MKLAHLALWTNDIEAAAMFWQEHFGATAGARYDSRSRPGFASRFLTLGEDGLKLELMEGP